MAQIITIYSRDVINIHLLDWTALVRKAGVESSHN